MNAQMLPQILRSVDACPAPGLAIALVRRGRDPEFHVDGWADTLSRERVALSHYWDLASLTKVMLTLPSVLKLVQSRVLALDSTLGDVWPLAVGSAYSSTKIWELLSHTSGAPAEVDLREFVGDSRENLYDRLLRTVPDPTFRGLSRYSDVGMMLAGGLVEHASGESLRAQAGRSEWLTCGPLGSSAVATELCSWRGRLIQGEPHDENAAVFPDLIAGHAGTFATISQVASFAALALSGRLLGTMLTEVATRPWTPPTSNTQFGLGFRLPGQDLIGGSLRGRDGFGATGFVGNVMWIEPSRGYAVVLLSNRVHPLRGERGRFDAWTVSLLDAISLELSPAS